MRGIGMVRSFRLVLFFWKNLGLVRVFCSGIGCFVDSE